MKKLVKFLSPWILIALLTTACGGSERTSSSSSVKEAPPAESNESDNTEVQEDEEPESEETQATETEDEDTEPEPEAPTFGDIEWPCGPGDATGATDQGVTDENILIGGGDDRGFVGSLGLNITQTDTIQAFVDLCNEMGGILGRQITVELYDAKIFEVSSVWLDACPRMFMMVGEGFAVDGFGEESRVQCELAHIPAWTVSAAAAHGPWMIQPVPNPADRMSLSIATWISENAPQTIKSSATVYGNFAATIENKDKVLASYPQIGFEFDINLEYNINGEDDWTPFILSLKDAGIQHVYFTGTCLPNYQAFRASAAVNDFQAIYSVDPNFYEDACRKANSDGVMNNTFIRSAYIPFEERDSTKAVDDYLKILESSEGEIALLGMQTASAFLLWATAAKSCGSNLTRDCVLTEAEAIDQWTGGGLHVPSDPGVNETPPCGLVMELVDDTYSRVFPEEPGTFACDDSWSATFTTEWSEQAKLDENRVSHQFTD
ncbi:MAG: ABC transporter substrate-binding protein [Acidimicrobiales bacterium]|nr:ABC transporter substrate-binding protein [Acidimicrobiales bacterium]